MLLIKLEIATRKSTLRRLFLAPACMTAGKKAIKMLHSHSEWAKNKNRAGPPRSPNDRPKQLQLVIDDGRNVLNAGHAPPPPKKRRL